MSVSETKRLLRELRIIPNKLLGQNFIVEPSIFPKLTNYASLGKTEVVLDAGAGFGFLTRFLAKRCENVLAVEKDPRVAMAQDGRFVVTWQSMDQDAAGGFGNCLDAGGRAAIASVGAGLLRAPFREGFQSCKSAYWCKG